MGHSSDHVWGPLLVAMGLAAAGSPAVVGCAGSTDEGAPPASGGKGGAAGAAGAAGATPPPDVTGTVIDVFVTPSGEESVPADPSVTTVAVLTHDAANNFETHTGVIDGKGSFVIKDVPAGPFMLRYEIGSQHPLVRYRGWRPSFVVTRDRELALGSAYYGRGDVQEAPAGSKLVFDVDGLNPFQPSGVDAFEFFAIGSGTYAHSFDQRLEGGPPFGLPMGATKFAGTVDSSGFPFPALVDGSRGDRAVLTQAVGSDPFATPFLRSIAKVYEPPSFTQASGDSTSVTGAFADVPQTQMSFQWNQSEYLSLTTAVHPFAEHDLHFLNASPEPGGPNRITGPGKPLLGEVLFFTPVDGLTNFSYGNPFPPEWPVLVSVGAQFVVNRSVPGVAGPVRAHGAVASHRLLDALANSPVTPLLTPPRDIRLNGQDAALDLTGVGATPTLSFTAPEQGTPAGYHVFVMTNDSQDDLFYNVAAHIVTTETEFVLPPDVLRSGSYYVIEVVADTSIDAKSPFKPPGERESASALTGVISP
jgi:hypothetical protein